MSGVPYTFGTATTSIPLSNLDSNFVTPVTIGNASVALGNTISTIGNLTLNNVTINSGTSAIGTSQITNGTSNVTILSSGGAVNIATNGTTAITVDTSQKVGIGTTSPSNPFVVSNAGAVGLEIAPTGGVVSSPALISYNRSGAAWAALSYYANYHVFGVSGTTEAMRIDSSGKVLIGSTTNPFNSNLYLTATPTANAPIASFYSQGAANASGIALYNDAASVGIWSQSGALTFRTNGSLASGSETMRIDSSGNLLVNTTSVIGAGKVSIAYAGNSVQGMIINDTTGTAAAQPLQFRSNNTVSGYFTTTGGTSAFVNTSDYRLKENVSPIVGALDKIIALKPVTYKWILDNSDGEGFIAHELQEIIPNAVFGEKDAVNEDGSIKPQGIDQTRIIATLTAAIQEQQALIESLTTRLTALESK